MTYTTPFYRIASHHVASPARLASSCAVCAALFQPSNPFLTALQEGAQRSLFPPTSHDARRSTQASSTQRTPSCLAIPATKPRTAARPRQEPSLPRATTRMTLVCLCLLGLCLLSGPTWPSLFYELSTDHRIPLCTSPPQQNYNGYAPPPQPGYGYQSSPQPYGFNGGVRTTFLTPPPQAHPRLTKPHDIASHRFP